MHASSLRAAPTRSTIRRAAGGVLALLAAGVVAVGCGGDGGGSDGASGIVGDEGPLAWLPAETWLIATVNLDPARIDEAVDTLDRLPIWSLAEGFLPASDGAGLRRELLEEVAKAANEEDGKGKGDGGLTARDLEDAFGNRIGFAITDNDVDALAGDDEDMPLAVWIEVDDEDRAVEVSKELFPGEDREAEHEGVTYFDSTRDEPVAWLVRDGLLVLSTGPERLEALIDTREGDEDSLANDEVARATIKAGVGDALLGYAMQTDPLLAAVPDLVREVSEESMDRENEAAGSGDVAPGSEEAAESAARAAEVAGQIAPLLTSGEFDDLIPDWVASSTTIDETGLRMRGTWSNPRDLAEPEPGSRELAERMPADVPIVQAGVTDGSTVRRLQEAWAEVRDEADLDLRAAATECAPADRLYCTFGAELALALLEDEDLAEASEDAGDQVFATVQDITPLLQLAARSPAGLAARASRLDAAAAPNTPPADEPGAEPLELTSPIFEYVLGDDALEWISPKELADAATAAGLVVEPADDFSSFDVSVVPGSAFARELAGADPQGLGILGIDATRLRSAQGVRLEAEQVDGLHVWRMPFDVPSRVVPALEGDAEVLGDDDVYAKVVEAAGVPDEVGTYGYVGLSAYVEAIIELVGEEDETVRRAIPTVRNNLADMPGIVWWTSRDEVDGEAVGTFEWSLPILE